MVNSVSLMHLAAIVVDEHHSKGIVDGLEMVGQSLPDLTNSAAVGG